MNKTILVLAANPKNTPPLRLDQEVREIENGLERAQKRDEFTIKHRLAARPVDVRFAMLNYMPNIVHFCGHGSAEEGLAFEDELGQAKLVSAEALSGFFELFADKVECVVLNACYSEVQADAIAQHISFVIGMKEAIGDAAAIEFAAAFYDALGAGEAVEFAYKLACNAIHMAGLSEHLVPVLKKRGSGHEEYLLTKETAFRSKLSVSEEDGMRTVFVIPKRETIFGMAKREHQPEVDLTLRLLPVRNRTESPENWDKSAMISKIHGRLKVVAGKVFVRDDSRNGVFLRGVAESDDADIDRLGEWAELYGTLDEDQQAQRRLVRLPKAEWVAVPDHVDLCLGKNLLRLRMEVCRLPKSRKIAAVRLTRTSNYPQHEYVLLIESLLVGPGVGNAIRLWDVGIHVDSAFEVFTANNEYWIRSLGDNLVWLDSSPLPLGTEIKLQPGSTLRVGHSTLRFEAVTDEDFVTVE